MMPPLNHAQDQQTILNSLQLPAEIWANVVLYVDVKSGLAALCRTCRVIQPEAERALYRHLVVDRRSLLFKCLSALPLHLADHVQSIFIGEAFISDQMTAVQEDDHILKGLMQLRNLKSFHCSRPTYLKTYPDFPFQLVELLTSAELDDIKSFFDSQPSIERLWWNPGQFKWSASTLGSGTLPNLSVFHTDIPDIVRAVLSPSSRRRVTRVAIGFWHKDSELPTAQCPFVKVLRFPDSLSVITKIQIHTIFPNLKYLECHAFLPAVSHFHQAITNLSFNVAHY